jgi:hypothetical protein
MGWWSWFGLAPATLEFWVRFPNERRNPGNQAHPVLKYWGPHRSLREQLCNRYCSNKHTLERPSSSTHIHKGWTLQRERERASERALLGTIHYGVERGALSLARERERERKRVCVREGEREREREGGGREGGRDLLGTIHNGGSKAARAHGLHFTTLRSA